MNSRIDGHRCFLAAKPSCLLRKPKREGTRKRLIEIQSLRTGQRTTLVHGGFYGRYAASGHLLYIRQNTLYAAAMDAGRLALTGPTVRLIDNVTGDPATGFAPMDITRNGILVYVKERPSHGTPAWLDRASHAEALLPAEADCGETRLSPDGKRLALTRYDGNNRGIWMMELDRGTNSRLTSAQGLDTNPVWSPDGTHLVFSSEAWGRPGNL